MTLVFPVARLAPEMEPVSVDMLKLQVRVDGGEEDALLADYLRAARECVESGTGRRLMAQVVEFTLDAWPCDELQLAVAPVQSVDSITYTDAAGETRLLSEGADYVVRTRLDITRIRSAHGKSWPPLGPDGEIIVTATVGYGAAADVPQALKQAVLFLAAHFYENRAPVNVGNIVNELPLTFRHLVEPYRLWLI